MRTLPFLASLTAGFALALVACERKVVIVERPHTEPIAEITTFETMGLKNSIDAYEKQPTDENAAGVRKAFAKLDGEIAELEGHVAKKTGEPRAEAAAKLVDLTRYRSEEKARFTRAQVAAGVLDARTAADQVEDAARNTGDALKNAAKELGNAIEEVGKKAGDAIKDVGR